MAVTIAMAVVFVGLTVALVDGFHDNTAPAEENAAKCWCATPLAVVNEPPDVDRGVVGGDRLRAAVQACLESA